MAARTAHDPADAAILFLHLAERDFVTLGEDRQTADDRKLVEADVGSIGRFGQAVAILVQNADHPRNVRRVMSSALDWLEW